MPVATNIDDVIAFASTDIAEVSYGNVASLFDQMTLWTEGLLSEATGIFKPSANETQAGQRSVTDWYSEHLFALDAIEGPAAGDSGVVGTSAVINAVVRVANAVKYATINNQITSTQETAVVSLYNAVWA